MTWGGADGILPIIRDSTAMRPIFVILTAGEIRRSKAATLVLSPLVRLIEKRFRLRDLEVTIQTHEDRLVVDNNRRTLVLARDQWWVQ